MKRFFLGCLAVAIIVIAGLWLSWSALMDLARERIIAVVTTALGMPSQMAVLEVSIVPPRVRLGAVVLGDEPAVLGRLEHAEVRLQPLASLLELRPVLNATVRGVVFDVANLPLRRPAATEKTPAPAGRGLPALRVSTFELHDASVRLMLQGAPLEIRVEQAQGHVESTSHPEEMTAELRADAVAVQRHDHMVAVREVYAAGGMNDQGVFIQQAALHGDGIEATLNAAAAPQQYRLSAALELAGLSALLDQAITGAAHLDGTLHGDLINPDLQAAVTIKELRVQQQLVGEVSAQVTRAGVALRLADMRIVAREGELSGTAAMTMSGALAVQATLTLRGFDVDALLAPSGQNLQFNTQLQGTAAAAGSLDPLDLELHSSGVLQKLRPPAPSNGGATVQRSASAEPPSGREAAFDLTSRIGSMHQDVRLEVTQPEGNRISANITSGPTQLRGPAKVEIKDLAALSDFLPQSVRDLSLSGSLQAEATVSGSLAAPAIDAHVAGTDMSVMGVSVPQLTGAVAIRGVTLTTEGVRLETGNGAAEMSGVVALDRTGHNDWRLTLDQLDTDFVVGIAHTFSGSRLPISGGALRGQVRVQGPWARLDAEAEITAGPLYVSTEPVEHIGVYVTARWPEWSLRGDLVHVADQTITVTASGRSTEQLQVAIDSTAIDLSTFRGAARQQIEGMLYLSGRLSGALSRPDGALVVSATGIGIAGRRLEAIELRADGAAGSWKLTGAAFHDALTLAAGVRTAAGFPYTLSVRLDHLELARLLGTDESVQVVTTGSADLHGSLATWSQPSGRISLSQLDIARDAYHVTVAEPIRIDADDGVFRIRSLVLTSSGSRLDVGGQLTLAGAVDLRANGAGSLSLLELLGSPISAARGEFTISATMRRRPDMPWELSGQAQLRDGSLDLGLPIAFTETNGQLSLSGGNIRIDRLDGRAGGGRFQVAGGINLNTGPDLSWHLEEIAVSTAEGLEAQISGNGQVRGSWRTIDVSGAIEVVNALYDRNIELTDLLPSLRASLAPAPRTEAPAVAVRLDLLVYASGGIHIDNNVAKAELWLNLQIAGTAAQPALSGTVGFLSGQFTFRRRTFEVTGGALDFRDRTRINPVLNITAESEISTADADYTVTVAVTGTADNPRVQLGADDPNLSQNDIISLITFGRTTAQMQREGGGVSAVDALALLPTGAATGQVGHFIGVDQFEVEAAQSRTSGSIEPRVTIGKDLTDRFRASLSSSFGVQSQRLAQLEYRLTPRVSLLGTWENATQSQAGAFEGDIKFRYNFRTLPAFSLLPGGLRTAADGDRR